MPIAVVKPTRAELDRCVARFGDLQRCDTGLTDMQLPEGRRTFLNVLGFSQPKAAGQYSPSGEMAPAAEPSPAAIRRLVEAGIFTSEQAQAALNA